MRVAVYYNNHDIRIEDRPKPDIGPGELLIKMSASGICGTDVMEWYRIKKAPRILGHEVSGTIVETKSEKFKIGQRVFASHHVPCNECKYCLDDNHTACDTLHSGNYDPGGYSEFIRIPKINVELGIYVLPDSISDEEGTFIEPVGCVIRAQRLIGIKEKQTVLVLGSGVSGLLNIQLAKLNGAHVIATDIDDHRLKMALDFGADKAINANADLDIKADRIIICAGAMDAVKQAFRSIDRKGIVLLFAIPDKDIAVPTTDFWRNEITILSSYGAAPRDLEEAMDLIKARKIKAKEMITHRLPLEKIQEGFNIVTQAGKSLKVVLVP